MRTTQGHRSAQDDRIAALEEKLDRLLKVLERAYPTGAVNMAPAVTPAEDGPVVGVDPAPASGWSLAKSGQDQARLDVKTVPVTQTSTRTYTVYRDVPSLSDRIQALEQQMQAVRNRLERVEGQVKSLEARVGARDRGRVSGPAKK